jgi:hypothetical protein
MTLGMCKRCGKIGVEVGGKCGWCGGTGIDFDKPPVEAKRLEVGVKVHKMSRAEAERMLKKRR